LRFFFSFFLIFPSLQACHQAAFLSEPRIVEQSRRERPEWVNLPTTHTVRSGETIEYHTIKTKVMDLPLGLRQAEASALNDTRLTMANELQLFWKKDRLFQELDSVERGLLMQHLEKLLDGRITPALISDMYFEKIFDPRGVMALEETYSIHVRIQIERSELQRILSDLRKFCQSSLSQGLIRLAQNEQVFSTQP